MKSKRNIILLTQDFPPEIGGIQTWSYELSKHLSQLGYFVTVLTKLSPNIDTEWDSNQDFKIIRLKSDKWRNKKNFRLFRALLSLRKENPIIIGANWKMSFPAVLFSKLFPTSVYTVFHGLDTFEYRKKNRLLQKYTINNGTKAVCVSNYTKSLIEGNYSNEKFCVINNGIDSKKFYTTDVKEEFKAKYKIQQNKINILCLGRLEERKGFDYTVLAIKEIEGVILHICGTGNFENRLKEIVSENKLEDKVFFHGNIPDSEINQLYNSMDIYSMPSRNINNSVEGFGITYLEAACTGLPVIGGKNSGAKDAILKLMERKNRDEISKNALKIVPNKFSWLKIAEQYSNLFENNN